MSKKNTTVQNAAITEQPTVEQPTVEQPTVEQPTVEQPTVEQPTTTAPAPTSVTLTAAFEGTRAGGSAIYTLGTGRKGTILLRASLFVGDVPPSSITITAPFRPATVGTASKDALQAEIERLRAELASKS